MKNPDKIELTLLLIVAFLLAILPFIASNLITGIVYIFAASLFTLLFAYLTFK